MLRRAKLDHSGRATVLLEFPATTGNAVILNALVTQQPTGVAAVPATFFNAEVCRDRSDDLYVESPQKRRGLLDERAQKPKV